MRYRAWLNAFLTFFFIHFNFSSIQIDVGTIPLPKSVTKSRIYANIDIFDFKLTEEEIAYIDTFNTGERIAPFSEAVNNIHYPFNIEF